MLVWHVVEFVSRMVNGYNEDDKTVGKLRRNSGKSTQLRVHLDFQNRKLYLIERILEKSGQELGFVRYFFGVIAFLH